MTRGAYTLVAVVRAVVMLVVAGIAVISRIVQSLVGSAYVHYITSEINTILAINPALSD